LAVAIRPTVRLALAGVVGALLLVSVISLGALPPVAVTPYRMTVGSAYGSNQLGKLFWERKVPSSCHYRFTPSEILWMKLLQRSRDETNCDADIFQRLADLFGQPSPTPHQGSIPNIASGSPPSQGCR